MTTTIDIAVVLDCSPSIISYHKQIRLKICSAVRKVRTSHQNEIRLALIEFQSHTDDQITYTHPFTSSTNQFEEWIHAVQIGRSSFESKAVVDALDAALTLDWRPNDNANRYHEKLVILITDGPPCNLLNDDCHCNSKDLWEMADEFLKQDITLVVVGVEPSVVVCDDFYCALANKTGGEYIPFINASRVLSFVIQQAILNEYTLSYLLHHLDVMFDIEYRSLYHYSHVQGRARYMIEECETLTDIRKLLFTHRHRSTEVFTGEINVDDFEPHSPSLNGNDTNYLLSPTFNIITSTPTTDDEGYRTRLPTTASADSSFFHSTGSPVLSYHLDLDWTSENDDDCFYKNRTFIR